MLDIFISSALASEAGVMRDIANSQAAGLLPLVMVFVMLYFLVIRPHKIRAKKHAQMLSELKDGDAVLINGGLFGEIVDTNHEGELKVRISEGVLVKVARASVSKAAEIIKNKGVDA